MRKLNIIFVLFLIVSTIPSCGYLFGKKINVEIPDVSKDLIDTVNIQIPKNKNVYKLIVEVKGQVSSSFSLNGKDFESGSVDVKMKDGDYYGTDYLINYKPFDKKTKGSLSVNLTFYYN
jgi:uncharacterized protein YcnI